MIPKGLRSIVKAPLEFSPLGLEENEQIGQSNKDTEEKKLAESKSRKPFSALVGKFTTGQAKNRWKKVC